jgi:tetratricopeptide (TPR) repeat protein
MVRGLILSKRRLPDEAAAEFRKCTSLSVAKPDQLVIMAQTFLDAGEVAWSLKVVDYALRNGKVRPENLQGSLLRIRANGLVIMGKLDQAVESYNQAASSDPGTAYLSLCKAGETLMREKKYKEALVPLLKSIKSGNMNGFTYQHIGECYLEQNEAGKAIEPLKTSISEFEEFRKNKDTEAYLPGLVTSHKLLVRAYSAVANRKEAGVWQRRLDTLVTDLDSDFFERH